MNQKKAAGILDENEPGGADPEGLFRRYGPMVWRRCKQMLGDYDEAADAAQEVFVKVLQSKNALSAEFPSSFLWTAATNHCLNLLRDKARRSAARRERRRLLEKIACFEDIEDQVGYRSLLRKLFNRHPESSRTIAVLHLVDGMTLEEVAREVKMSESGVRKRLRDLRKTLEEMGGV